MTELSCEQGTTKLFMMTFANCYAYYLFIPLTVRKNRKQNLKIVQNHLQ